MDFLDKNYYVGNEIGDLIFGYTKRHKQNDEKDSQFNLALYVEDDIDNVCDNQNLLSKEINFDKSKWIQPIQKHGGNIRKVTKSDRGTNIDSLTEELYDVDGLYTYDRDSLIAMNFADCVPVYVYSVVDDYIALGHAGWRGTVNNITSSIIRAYDGDVSNLRVIIGPSINKDAYEVDQKVIDALVNNGMTESCYTKTETGFLLDLKCTNKQQAISCGISKAHITVTPLGTEDIETFFSYRVEDGKTGRALAFIGRKSSDN